MTNDAGDLRKELYERGIDRIADLEVLQEAHEYGYGDMHSLIAKR